MNRVRNFFLYRRAFAPPFFSLIGTGILAWVLRCGVGVLAILCTLCIMVIWALVAPGKKTKSKTSTE